ncbi:hypothetical protein BpHYR1_047592 [Brachionus plicatilis]|uniref:Uncharacterized protein n=1 Tax=Brachionus plicatilis TaxID=10195 RepID=A0A3M7QHA2_BRAPC|nr:hypothetical protein BpHYR1_047592 [Brachionus plicatilis]
MALNLFLCIGQHSKMSKASVSLESSAGFQCERCEIVTVRYTHPPAFTSVSVLLLLQKSKN